MKYIENVKITLTGRARHFAWAAHAAKANTEGVFTTVAHFLCGDNPWGFHNDLRFSMPPTSVKQGMRIVAAAEMALVQEGKWILLSDEDYEALVSAAFTPNRHPKEMQMPADLARAIVPLLDAIESAVDELVVEEPK